MTSWYHFDCFFERQRPKSAGDIEHFDQLRWEDQEKINEKIKGNSVIWITNMSQVVINFFPNYKGINDGTIAVIPSKKGKGKKDKVVEHFSDYTIEYAKSGRAACRGCLEKIAKVLC